MQQLTYEEDERSYNHNFRHSNVRYRLNQEEFADRYPTVEAFRRFLQSPAFQNLHPDTYVRFTFFAEGVELQESYSDVSTAFFKVRDLDELYVTMLMFNFLRYRVEDHMRLEGDDTWPLLSFVQMSVESPNQGIGSFFQSLQDAVKRSRSIVTIKNKDNLCLFYAIAIALGYQSRNEKHAYVNSLLKEFTHIEVIRIRQGGLLPEDVQKIANTQKIVVHEVAFYTPDSIEDDVEHTPNVSQFFVQKSFYPDVVTIETEGVFYLRDKEHAHAIKLHTQLLGGSKCRWFCHLCCNFQVTQKSNRTVNGGKWHYHHCRALTNEMEQCKECENCGRTHYLSYVCTRSAADLESEDQLLQSVERTPVPKYIELVEKESKELKNIIFFDFETFVDVDNNSMHTPTHVCATFYNFPEMSTPKAEKILEPFKDDLFSFPSSESQLVSDCGDIFPKYLRMEGMDCLHQFSKFLATLSNFKKKMYLFAHNGSRFDNLILFNSLKKICKPEGIIMQGTRLLQAQFSAIRCTLRDTFLILPFPLAAFAKTFQLPQSKDYYPYDLHTPENLWEVPHIPFPSLKDFNIHRMKEGPRQALKTWYESQDRSQPYCLNSICRLYCLRDVLVLHAGVHKFRMTTLASDHIDPLTKLTTPSLAYSLFRRDYLEANTLQDMSQPILFEKDVLTQHSAQWMEYEMKKRNISDVETHVDISLDGFEGTFRLTARHLTEKLFFLFVDERSVAMPPYFSPDARFEDYQGIRNETVYTRFQARLQQLSKQFPSFHLVFMSLRKWRKKVQRAKLTLTLSNPCLLPPLEPRQSYFGGRVEPWMYYTHVGATLAPSKISKIDVVSLYPSVMIHNYYPMGTPVRYLGNEVHDIRIENVFGFIQCEVSVPTSQLFPLLPHQHDGKLKFPCGRFTGVFTSVELNHAIKFGSVTVEKVFDILHYPMKRNDLFTTFIQSCIKGKMESSGLPQGKTKEQYIEETFQNSGIRMEADKIEKNPILRLENKLKANSFYGKFAEGSHPHTKTLFTHQSFYDLLDHDAVEILSMIDIGSSQKFCTYKKQEDLSHAPNTNVSIATFVTSYARMVLWDAIQKIFQSGSLPIYGDTDSIVFLHQKDSMEEIIQSGVQLGEWEIECCDTIEEVVVMGPKAYSCKCLDGSIESHCKGVTLHVENQVKLSHQHMVDMIQGRCKEVTVSDFRLVENFRDLRGPHFPTNYSHQKNVHISTDKRRKISFHEYQPGQEYGEVEEEECASNRILFSTPPILYEDCYGNAIVGDVHFKEVQRHDRNQQRNTLKKSFYYLFYE